MYENITKDELYELCKNWEDLTDNDIIELSKANKRLYPINEMAYTRGMFIGLCGDLSEQITNNLIYIIILGSYEPFGQYVNHWKSELLSYITKLYKCNTEKSVKKDKIIYDYIIDTYVDQLTLEFDNVDIAINALKDEIRKGKKNKSYQYEVMYIERNILPNIDNIIDEHKHEFAKLYKALIKTFKQKDFNIFKQELCKYLHET